MSLIASDGYEYKDLTQRLLGNPRDVDRNRVIKALRRAGYPENETTVWYEAYDSARGPHSERHRARWRAIDRERQRTNRLHPG